MPGAPQYPSVHPSIHPSIHLSIYLSISLSLYRTPQIGGVGGTRALAHSIYYKYIYIYIYIINIYISIYIIDIICRYIPWWLKKNLDIDDMLRIVPAMMKCRRNPWGEKLPLSCWNWGISPFNEIGESMVCQWGEINRIFFSHQTWEVNGDESWAAIEKPALRPIISIMHPSLPHQAACRASEPQTSPGLRPLPATIANHLFKARYPLVISSLEKFPNWTSI